MHFACLQIDAILNKLGVGEEVEARFKNEKVSRGGSGRKMWLLLPGYYLGLVVCFRYMQAQSSC